MRTLKFMPGRPKLSIILLDWAVRESFHSLDYLNDQTVERSEYELIWIEFFDHVPDGLSRKVTELDRQGKSALDQWVVIGANPDVHVHKHYAYNVGIALAQGEICMIADSDAMYPRNFVEKILATFQGDEPIAVHVDEVRNYNHQFFPFNYPTINEVLRDSQTTNWNGTVTTAMAARNTDQFAAWANYGACMVARRKDMIAVGGADEHLDYLGYFCGPYDMTFRLANAGHREVWLDDLVLVHTWHPGDSGDGNVGGPSDGRGSSLRALQLRTNRRIMAEAENPAIRSIRERRPASREDICAALRAVDLNAWKRDVVKLAPISLRLAPEFRLVKDNVGGHNIILYKGVYYGCPPSLGDFVPADADRCAYSHLAQGDDYDELCALLKAHPAPEYFFPVLIQDHVRGYNVLLYKDRYFACPLSLGSFDPAGADRGQYDGLLQHSTLAGILAKLEDAPPPEDPLPRLIREFCGYNVVSYRGRYFGCLPSLGAFNPADAHQGRYGGLLQASDLAGVLAKIEGSLSPEDCIPRVVRENVRGRRVFRYKRVYYAVPPSHGPFVPAHADGGTYKHFVCPSPERPASGGLRHLMRLVQGNSALNLFLTWSKKFGAPNKGCRASGRDEIV